MSLAALRRACARKIKYPNRSVAKRSQRALRQKGQAVKVYYCSNCDGWHIASAVTRTVSRLLFRGGLM